MSSLESRVRSLLRFYPPSYRADRGEEMLGTLLEASAPGRNWPAPRDARSLIAGGLRARASLNRQLPAGTSLRLALMLGIVLWLTAMPSTLLNLAMPLTPTNFEPFWPGAGAAYGTCALLLVATIAAPWFARRAVTISLALITAVALGLLAYQVYGPHPINGVYVDVYGPRLIISVAQFVVPLLALAAVVAAEPVRPPRCWLWLPAAATVAFALLYLQIWVVDPDTMQSSIVGITATGIEFGLVGAIVLWLTVDARPALAFVIALELTVAPNLAVQAMGGYARTSHYVLALAPLAACALAMVRLRRKAVL